MNHLHIDATQLAAAKLRDFAAGSFVMVPTETSSAPGPFWGLRFDGSNEDGATRNILWLNGMPWHGSDALFSGMLLDNDACGDMRGIRCGQARIEIDLSSGAGRAGREMRWEQAAGFIVTSLRGSFLVGRKPSRQIWGAHYAVDLATSCDVPDAFEDTAVEWFARWSVVVETKRGAVVLPFSAPEKVAPRTL